MAENIYTRLMKIQAELDVPKTRLNKFAKPPFYYRNAEDILAAAKPICHKNGCVLTLTDEPKMIGNRYYIEATAILTDGEGMIKTTASAREEESRKSYDCSQLTGSASSYARKYALNGLFDLDDANDPDYKDNSELPTAITCPECGRDIQGYTAKNGRKYSPSDVFAKFGRCANCEQENRRASSNYPT